MLIIRLRQKNSKIYDHESTHPQKEVHTIDIIYFTDPKTRKRTIMKWKHNF